VNVGKAINRLHHILAKHNYPKNQTFNTELQNALKEKTGNDNIGELCVSILQQKF
jgi:hypothetical protein